MERFYYYSIKHDFSFRSNDGSKLVSFIVDPNFPCEYTKNKLIVVNIIASLAELCKDLNDTSFLFLSVDKCFK